MKRFVFILLIMSLLCSVFFGSSMLAFAEGGADTNVENEQGESDASSEIDVLKDELWGLVERVWAFISSNETYKNIATAVLGVLAFLTLPIIMGVIVFAYMILAILALFVDLYAWVFELIFGMSLWEWRGM